MKILENRNIKFGNLEIRKRKQGNRRKWENGQTWCKTFLPVKMAQNYNRKMSEIDKNKLS